MAEHIHGVISSCSQTLHALKSLPCPRHARLCSSRSFRAVVIAKLCYASSAWWGFSTAGDNQRLTAFIRRSIRQGYCTTDHVDITSFIDTADDNLFRQILTNPNHVLAHLLPEKVNTSRITNLDPGPRQHDRQLIPKTTKLYSWNFVIRMLYTNIHIGCSYWYWLLSFLLFLLYNLRFNSLILNEDDDDGGKRWPASPTCTVTSEMKALGGNSSRHSQGGGILWRPNYRPRNWLFTIFICLFSLHITSFWSPFTQ